MKLNTHLRLARKDAGLTQEELAAVLGVTVITIYRWECGKHLPTPFFRECLCRLFQLSEHQFGWPAQDKRRPSSGNDLPFLVDPDALTGKGIPPGQGPVVNEIITSPHRIIGLTGLPGSGKTAIAHALAGLQGIRHPIACVLWATVGKDAHPLRHLQRWLRLLGNESVPDRLEEAQDLLRVLLRGTPALIVLDDLWNASDIIPYTPGPHCRYVLTTRLSALAHSVCDVVYRPRTLTDAQAFTVLTHELPAAFVREHREVLHALSQQVGYLPQALERLGRYIRGQAHSSSQRRVQEALTHLFHPTTYLQMQLPPDACSLSASIRRSEERLSLSARTAFSTLATHFPAAPDSFSERQVADLIHTTRQFQLRDLDQLVDVGLVNSVGRNRYQVHPVIAAYARLLVPCQDASQ